MFPKIHYEDKWLLIAEKPAGIPTVAVRGGRLAFADVLAEKFPALKSVGKKGESGIVHRLDNETSGLVLVAKTNEVYEKLREQFSKGEIQKKYLALVIGNPPSKETIETPIAHHPRKKKKMVVCETKKKAEELKARKAITTFEKVKFFQIFPLPLWERVRERGTNYTLLHVQIKTGVRHQIRAHLASIGFPLAGDKLYQNPKKQKEDNSDLKHFFLHASELGFYHPITGKWIEVNSIPAEVIQAWV